MDMIFTIGIFASLFYFVLLLNKKNKKLPDLILAIWMLVIGIHLTSTYLNSEGYWELYPNLIGITAPFPFFYGPMLYLYIYYSIHERKRIRLKDYLHFLPVVMSYTYLFPFYFFYSLEEKRMVDTGEMDDFSNFSIILIIAFILSAFIYTFLSFQLLKKHKNILYQNFSNTEHVNLNWLRGFIWGVGIIFITVCIVFVSRDIIGIEFPFNPDYIFYSLIILSILSLGYFGIRHENIFTDNLVIETEPDSDNAYKYSNLKEDRAREGHKALLKWVEEQKPFLEPNLTLHSLAEQLDISGHHLSQIINQYEHQNFNDFINKYRVEEFIQQAANNPHLSFLAVALDSGFNSKSTFNAVFRKHKGVTPSQFMSKYA